MRGSSWISMAASFTHMKSKITHKAKKIIFAIGSNVSSLAYILRSQKGRRTGNSGQESICNSSTARDIINPHVELRVQCGSYVISILVSLSCRNFKCNAPLNLNLWARP